MLQAVQNEAREEIEQDKYKDKMKINMIMAILEGGFMLKWKETK